MTKARIRTFPIPTTLVFTIPNQLFYTINFLSTRTYFCATVSLFIITLFHYRPFVIVFQWTEACVGSTMYVTVVRINDYPKSMIFTDQEGLQEPPLIDISGNAGLSSFPSLLRTVDSGNLAAS